MADQVKIQEKNNSISNSPRLYGTPFFQPKLSVNQPNDNYEQEADAIADSVMRKGNDTFFQANTIQRKCTDCEEEEKKIQKKPLSEKITKVQLKESDAGCGTVDTHLESAIQASKGSGINMNADTLGFMNKSFGKDFSGIKIHNDANAAQLSSDLNAKAFTIGNDIYFNRGEYNPDTDNGKHLLAHELTHTIQQAGMIQRKCAIEDKDNEITGVGKEVKYLKSLPKPDADNISDVPVVDGDKVIVKNTGGAAGYTNIKNCTWAWIDVPGKKSTDKNYPVHHGFIEAKYILSKVKQEEPKKDTPKKKEPEKEKPAEAPAQSEILSRMEGPEIIYSGDSYEYTASMAGMLTGTFDLTQVKWSFQYDGGDIYHFDTTDALTVNGTDVTLKVYIPTGKKADNIKIYAYYSTIDHAATKTSSFKEVSIVESKKAKGKNADGSVADDMLSGDFTKAQISDLGTLFSIDEFADYTDDQLFGMLTDMATSLFSVGDLETNALAMIAHFKENTGTDYSNPILTKAVKQHDATKRFLDHVFIGLSKKVLAEKEGLAQTAVTKGEIEQYRPVFNSTGDTFAGGLTFAINDTWSYSSELKYYDYVDDDNFKGTIRVTLYDDFGLDKPDVLKKFGYLAGFRAWFILQHERGYKPFITVVQFEKDFDQTIKEIEPRLLAEAKRAQELKDAYKKAAENPVGRGSKI